MNCQDLQGPEGPEEMGRDGGDLTLRLGGLSSGNWTMDIRKGEPSDPPGRLCSLRISSSFFFVWRTLTCQIEEVLLQCHLPEQRVVVDVRCP